MTRELKSLAAAIVIMSAACSTTHPDGVLKDELVLRSRTGAVDLPHQEGYVTAANTGMQLWYDMLGDPQNPMVLLLHGTDGQALSWRPHLYEPLVDAGFCVIRLDLRDNGLSRRFGKPDGFEPEGWTPEQEPPYRLEAMADDVAGVLDALRVNSAHLIGWSQGGAVAQLVAIHFPDKVRSLTLLATTPSQTFDEDLGAPAEDMIQWFKTMGPELGMNAAFLPFTRGKVQGLLKQFYQKLDPDFASARGEQILDEYVGAICNGERDPNPMSWQGMALVAAQSRIEALAGLSTPTLVVHGNKDIWIQPAHGEALAAAIPGAKLIMVQGAGHVFPLGIHTDYIGDVIAHLQAAQG